MQGLMERSGYTARIDFDADAGVFHGRILNIRDVVTFEGASVKELEVEFDRSLAVYLEVCRKNGLEPSRPFSGQFVVRTSPEAHRAIATAAEAEGKSLNAWVDALFEREIATRATTRHPKRARQRASGGVAARSRRKGRSAG